MIDRVLQQWRESERRLAELQPVQQVAVDRVCERLVIELRRRLGSAFTTKELVGLYEDGTGWCFDIATEMAPGAAWAWEPKVIDAAFARYVNGASDYAGGRRLYPD